ncbi:hypothetical protein M9458_045472, partial [Cirrhinus mrigala]
SGETKETIKVMTWYFHDILIANISRDQSEICTNDRCKDRFRDRLEPDLEKGSLTITNINITDSGPYELKITIRNSSFCITRVKRFNVTVF